MRDFTPEEKELIASTPITAECFESNAEILPLNVRLQAIPNNIDTKDVYENMMYWLDIIRSEYILTKDERYFTELVRLLPNSYKVVKL